MYGTVAMAKKTHVEKALDVEANNKTDIRVIRTALETALEYIPTNSDVLDDVKTINQIRLALGYVANMEQVAKNA